MNRIVCRSICRSLVIQKPRASQVRIACSTHSLDQPQFCRYRSNNVLFERRPVLVVYRPLVMLSTSTDRKDLTTTTMPSKDNGKAGVGKASLIVRIKNELVHYYHGFRLFLVELKIAFRLLGKVFRGRSLTRRERRHFTRTVADIFRIVPFAIFIVVPFMEFLLPFYLKFFPGMLPSTFATESKTNEKLRKQMKAKLQVAKFLQDTLEESAMTSKPNDFSEFNGFMQKVRTGNEQPTSEEIMKFAALLKDELTLDNLSHLHLVCLCQLLNLSSVGPDYVLKLQIKLRLRLLEADDKLIQRDGIDTLTPQELQKACRARGMCFMGISDSRLRSQLSQWIDFHLNHRIPVTLLLLSRSFYLPDVLSPQKVITNTISILPHEVVQATASHLKLISGTMDNKEKLDALRKEEDAIAMENQEKQEEEDSEKPTLAVIEPPAKRMEQIEAGKQVGAVDAKRSPKFEGEPLSDTELIASRLASALITLASQKNIDLSSLQLNEFKDDVEEHRVLEATVDKQTTKKSTKLLSNKINKLLKRMSKISGSLEHRKSELKASIKESEKDVTEDVPTPALSPDDIRALTVKKQNLIDVTEMIKTMEKLQAPISSGTLTNDNILEVIRKLDLDGDNKIDVADLLQVLEYVNDEGTEGSRDNLVDIAELIAKERLVEHPTDKQQRT